MLQSNPFSNAASHFDTHAAVLRELGQRLFERLDYVKLVPERILDLGTATGTSQLLLAKRYPEACMIGVDSSYPMLIEATNKLSSLEKSLLIQANVVRLPLADASMDLIFANGLLPWIHEMPAFFEECRRLLKPQGLILFNSLGPDSLIELRQVWRKQDNYDHVNPFIDMHDVGDALLAAGLSDPALDTEHITISYPSVGSVLRELKALGSYLGYGKPKRGLTTKRQLEALETFAEHDNNGRFPVTLEVVYGLAWGSEISMRNQKRGNDILLPVSSIKRMGAVGDKK